MKNLLLILLVFTIFSCKKKSEVEDVKNNETVVQNDISFVKFINPLPTSTVIAKYSSFNVHVSYHISNEILAYSAYGFQLWNDIRVDNSSTENIWSTKKLRFRTDTLDFVFDTSPFVPKNKIVLKSELLQMSASNDGYVIVKSDSLTYSVSPQ